MIQAIFNVFVVPYKHSSQTLKQAIEKVNDKINYKHDKKELTFTGFMSEEDKDKFKSVANVSDDFKDAIDALYEHSNAPYTDLIKTYPELLGVHAQYHSIKELVLDKLPSLVDRLKKSFIVESISTQFSEESHMINVLLDTVIADDDYILHSNGDAQKPMIVDFSALEEYGSVLSTDKKTLSFYLVAEETAE